MFNKKIKKVVIIEGMKCKHCKSKVENALSKIKNVSKVKVNLKEKIATIYSTTNINNDDIEKIITKLDYKIISIGENK